TIGTDSGYVTLGQGLYKVAGTDAAPQRLMKNAGTDTLAYSLSSVSSGGTEWGNTDSTGKATAVGTGADTTLTVFGRIPAGQNKPAGSYTDTVVATVTW
ncbi:MAG: spore coat protein U domain-containing protein, partial [Methylococcales bacterium]|nr:spore coat protein U domain-containing protein [Methylococcales bacterium]